MAKKKGKKLKQDTRGYSTSASAPKINATATTAKSDGDLQVLESTCSQLSADAPVSAITVDVVDTTSKRFSRRIENLYDQLIQYKFSDGQIKRVVLGLCSNSTKLPTSDLFTLESALDWLCLNEPIEELPAVFTEQHLREPMLQGNSSIEVVQPLPQLDGSSRHQVVLVESITQPAQLQKSVDVGGTDDDTHNDVDKSWILNQYEYDDVNDDHIAETVADIADEQKSQVEVLSSTELQLQKVELEIEALRSDVNDEASNYMRSKHEIKAMKQRLSTMQGQAKKLRVSIAKHKAREATLVEDERKASTTEVNEGASMGHHGNDEDAIDDYEDDMAVALLMFDEPDDDAVQQLQVKDKQPSSAVDVQDTKSLQSSQPSIPKGWTGTTPKNQLEEWCKKHKVPRPSFSKLANGVSKGSYRLVVKTTPEVLVDEQGPFFDTADSHQHVATIALFRLSPELPLYRLFPPVFRDLWKSWLHQAEQATSREKEEVRDLKNEKIRRLIDLIPKQLQIGDTKETKIKILVEEQPIYPSVDAEVWDERVDTPSTGSDPPKNQLGHALMLDFSRRRESAAYKAMQDVRQRLPMFAYRDELLKCVADNSVTVLCAETGAGKTTQGPQFILENGLESGVGDAISLICTQPRRISAMSVAERVADEMCVRLGDLVGYQIRGDAVKSQRTKLLFCTTGVVLRRLQEDPSLSGVTTVVVDEVHERSWQIDFLLIALRRLLKTSRPDLKVILMSATLDSEMFCSFFGGAPLVNVPGRTFPVAQYFLEDLMDATDHVIEEDSMFALRNLPKHRNTEELWITTRGGEKRRQVLDLESLTDYSHVSGHFPGYKTTTQRSLDRVDEKVLNYDLIEDTLVFLSNANNKSLLTPSGNTVADGSVLVFLPGMSEIRTMMNRLTGSRIFGDTTLFEIIPLHSSLSPHDQKRVFRPSRRGCRKIILATNIAETSVTIPDVVCVIDSGLVREVRHDKRYATSKLVLDWCSKASIKQRAGRAGRVKEGICCRLFSSRTAELLLKDQTTPELQRIPLEEVCLHILAGKLSRSCAKFLMQAPQPPPADAVNLAVRSLKEVGIVNVFADEESLTILGQHVARIPVNVRLAKMLIFGAVFKCLDPILTIVGALSVKSPFVQAMHDTYQAEAAQREFRHESSDFLSFVKLWNAYVPEVQNSKDQGRGYCRKKWINWTVMREIRDLREQNLELLCQIGFVQGKLREHDVAKSVYSSNGELEVVVHAVICSGLYPNIAHAVQEHKDDPPVLWHKQERLHFHSSSVNHKKKGFGSDWIMFHEKFATGRTTVSVTSPVHPLTLILFGGDVVVKHLERKVFVDDWIQLDMAAQTGVVFRELRRKLDIVLSSLIEKADSRSGDEMVDEIVNLLMRK